MTRERASSARGAWLVKVLLLVFGAALVEAILTLPRGAGLGDDVRAALAVSGVAHEVTAVLMNFRAYDTLLEIAVLWLALLGTRTLATPGGSTLDPGPVLRALAMLLIPFLILFAGYLLWAGAYGPGGAFQAGTLLAAAGVLSALAGYPWVVTLPDARLRGLVLLGPVVFVITAAAPMLGGARFLELAPASAHTLILVVESAATISIGMILLAAFHGVIGGPADEAT